MFHLFRFVYNFTVGHEHRAPTAMYIALLLLYYYFGGNNFCNDSTIVTKYGAFVPTTKKERSIDWIPILGKSSSLLLYLNCIWH